ncbi:MAG: twin-arginine translocation signal domain-containing protein [Planctomycetota bacterium]|jgi:hypothetical protein
MSKHTRREFLKALGLATASTAALPVLSSCSSTAQTTSAKTGQPNILVIMSDDRF